MLSHGSNEREFFCLELRASGHEIVLIQMQREIGADKRIKWIPKEVNRYAGCVERVRTIQVPFADAQDLVDFSTHSPALITRIRGGLTEFEVLKVSLPRLGSSQDLMIAVLQRTTQGLMLSGIAVILGKQNLNPNMRWLADEELLAALAVSQSEKPQVAV